MSDGANALRVLIYIGMVGSGLGVWLWCRLHQGEAGQWSWLLINVFAGFVFFPVFLGFACAVIGAILWAVISPFVS